MFDLNDLRKNSMDIRKAAALKGFRVDVPAILKMDKERRQLQSEFDQIRATKHRAGAELAKLTGVAKKRALANLKGIDKKEAKVKPQLEKIEQQVEAALAALPNPPLAVVPEGKGEVDNVEVRKWGEPRKFDFPALDHVGLAHRLDLIDFATGAKVGGSGFYFLKNEGVQLELALVQYALDFLKKRGFTPWITPDLARSKYYLGTGYLPRGPEAQTYEIKDQDLGLIATAEVTLAGVHADEILNESDLPKRYAGYSHCFRREAGSYGKYSKGLYRVHQFTKVEMFAYTKPEGSSKMHEELLALEEELWQSLDIPYRVLEFCTGALGAQAARKFDIEAWMPGRRDWGEVTSTSNTTDYQARRLDIRFRRSAQPTTKTTDRRVQAFETPMPPKIEYVHTLNGTAIATSRAIIAVLENYQQKDGSVAIPEVLRPYMGGQTEIRR